MSLFGKDEKNQKPICPLLNGPCIEHKCMFWTKLIGEDPQTRKAYDQWGCAIAWLPIMLVENAQMTRQGSSTVQEFRNDVHRVGTALAEESIKRRELEQQRLEIDKRLLEIKEEMPKLLPSISSAPKKSKKKP